MLTAAGLLAKKGGSGVFVGAVLVLVLLAFAVVLGASRMAESRAATSFQNTCGGFGGGSVLEPAWCFHALDPGLEATCPTQLVPVPGAWPFCPHETAGLTVFPSAFP